MKTLITIAILFIGIRTVAQDSEFKLNENYPIKSSGTIEMWSSDAEVTIKGTDRKDVSVNIYRKVTVKGVRFGERDFKVEVFEENGNLIIRERSKGSVSMVGYSREVYTIDIEAPRNVSLDLEGDDDDYLIENIGGSIVLDIDDGDADLSNCDGSDFDFDFDDGDIRMDGGKGKIRIRSDDGDVNIRNASFSEVEASMDDGDIEIETSLADNGTYFFRSNDGGVYLDVPRGGGEFLIYHDDSRVSFSGDFEVDRDDENETRLRSRRGNAKVKVRVDDGRVQINAR
ncbi:MAG: DUF4097 family beta strand repeat-containing protein [Bacteroidota bacterium]